MTSIAGRQTADFFIFRGFAKELVKKVDLVLVMSVEPGKGGQKFISNAISKIKKLRHYIDKNNLKS